MEENEEKLEDIKKADINDASKIFKDEILLNEDRINNLIEFGKKNKFNQKKVL